MPLKHPYLLVFELGSRTVPARATYAHVCVLCQSLTEAKARAVERFWRDQFDVERMVSFAVTIHGLEGGLLPIERKLLAQARQHRQRIAVYYRDSLQEAAEIPPLGEAMDGQQE